MDAVVDVLKANPADRSGDGRLCGVRVFVAEDEVLIAMDIQTTLEDDGAEVIGPCHTLSQAIACATDGDISVAILDLRLGRDSIAPVARALIARKIPFLFYSGQTQNDPMRAEWPDAMIVTKPANARELVGAVALLLSTSKSVETAD